MATSPAREKILKKIREALRYPVPLPFPASDGVRSLYNESAADPLLVFAEKFTALQGRFSYCISIEELRTQLNALIAEKNFTKVFCADQVLRKAMQPAVAVWHEDLADSDAAVTGCELLSARTGSIVLSSASPLGRTASVYSPIHICIAHSSQAVSDIGAAFKTLQTKYGDSLPSFISFASGPSRTADIEKTLVTGVHGPKEVYCFVTEENFAS